jgi:hypothetical protein
MLFNGKEVWPWEFDWDEFIVLAYAPDDEVTLSIV